MIRPYRAIDFSDVDFLNKICYEKPCSMPVLGEKLAHESWVADEYNAVIGCIIVCPQDQKNLIWSLTVAPPFRNRGIGGQLMAEAEKHFPELYLHTERYGMAYGLYARRGYTEIKDLPNYYGSGRNAVEMVKINFSPTQSNNEHCAAKEQQCKLEKVNQE